MLKTSKLGGKLPARQVATHDAARAGNLGRPRPQPSPRMKTRSAHPEDTLTPPPEAGKPRGSVPPPSRSTNSSTFAATDLNLTAVASGKLTWRTLLAWMRDDKLVSAEDIEQTARRFAGGNSAQHPLVRIASVGLLRSGDGKVLDAETLSEWLARRSKLPYQRIDPVEGRRRPRRRHHVDQLRRAAPRAAAHGRPHRSHDRHLRTARPRLGARDRVAHQEDGAPRHRQPDRDRPLHDRVLCAVAFGAQRDEDGRAIGARQLRAAGRAGQEQQAARRQRQRRDPGRRLAVAIRVRPARIRHPPRAAPREERHPLPHRWRDAHRLSIAARRDERNGGAGQAARPHGRHRAAPPARRPHQGPQPERRRSGKCACRPCRPRSARRW